MLLCTIDVCSSSVIIVWLYKVVFFDHMKSYFLKNKAILSTFLALKNGPNHYFPGVVSINLSVIVILCAVDWLYMFFWHQKRSLYIVVIARFLLKLLLCSAFVFQLDLRRYGTSGPTMLLKFVNLIWQMLLISVLLWKLRLQSSKVTVCKKNERSTFWTITILFHIFWHFWDEACT